MVELINERSLSFSSGIVNGKCGFFVSLTSHMCMNSYTVLLLALSINSFIILSVIITNSALIYNNAILVISTSNINKKYSIQIAFTKNEHQ